MCWDQKGSPHKCQAALLIFRTADNPSRMRVITSKTSDTPDASSWALLKIASGPITVQLTVARTESNLVAAGGDLYTSTTGVSFSIVSP